MAGLISWVYRVSVASLSACLRLIISHFVWLLLEVCRLSQARRLGVPLAFIIFSFIATFVITFRTGKPSLCNVP